MGSIIAEYAYDAQSRRIRKDTYLGGVLDNVEHFYCLGNSLIETRNGSDQVIQQHVWDNLVGQYIDCLAQVANNTTQGVDDLCDQELYALQDQQFNILALVDDAGDIVERYEYTLYGERTVMNDSYAVLHHSAFAMNCGFQGLYHDTETGLIYNRARMLSPTLERFIQRDPLGYPDGMNTYAAYHVMWGGVDPMGLSLRGWWNRTVWGYDSDLLEENERIQAQRAREAAEAARKRGERERARRLEEMARENDRRANGGLEEEIEEAARNEYERVRNARTIGVVRSITGDDSLTTGCPEEERQGECIADCIKSKLTKGIPDMIWDSVVPGPIGGLTDARYAPSSPTGFAVEANFPTNAVDFSVEMTEGTLRSAGTYSTLGGYLTQGSGFATSTLHGLPNAGSHISEAGRRFRQAGKNLKGSANILAAYQAYRAIRDCAEKCKNDPNAY